MKSFIIAFFFILFISSILSIDTFIAISYDNPDDCSSIVSSIDFDGTCFIQSDCSRGAVNLTISTDHGFCEGANLGNIASVGVYGFGIAEFVYINEDNCNVSYNAALATGFPSFNSYCSSYFWTVSSQGGQLITTMTDGLLSFNFTDY